MNSIGRQRAYYAFNRKIDMLKQRTNFFWFYMTWLVVGHRILGF